VFGPGSVQPGKYQGRHQPHCFTFGESHEQSAKHGTLGESACMELAAKMLIACAKQQSTDNHDTPREEEEKEIS
jgi:hypothetical protein